MTSVLERPVEVPLPAETVTYLKPSQAIRLGRLQVPHHSHGVLVRQRHDGTWAACALGSMAVGYGHDPEEMLSAAAFWPVEIAYPRVPPLCPCSGYQHALSAVSLIIHTYDGHFLGGLQPYITEQQIIEHLEANGL